MKPELEKQILDRWPDWFAFRDDVTRSLMGFGFQCDDGWFRLLVSTFEGIEPHVAVWNQELAGCGAHFEILEVKEKFGELRIVAMGTNEAIYTALLEARDRSRTVCELCGAPGQLRSEGYWRVRCNRCTAEESDE